MKKIRAILLPGEWLPRDPVDPIKNYRYLPIKTTTHLCNNRYKEVGIMEVASFNLESNNFADQMKSIRKVRLQREVLENPEMARRLVKVEATGVYNAKGDVIQAVTGDLADA